jgi:hypothetical protein
LPYFTWPKDIEAFLARLGTSYLFMFQKLPQSFSISPSVPALHRISQHRLIQRS